MTNSTKFALTAGMFVAASIAVATSAINEANSGRAAAVEPAYEMPVRATKGDRLHTDPAAVRQIEGVTLVMREFNQIIR